MRPDQRPTRDQWGQMCREAIGLLSSLEANGYALIERAKLPTRDGFPTSSRGDSGGSSGEISDPTGNAVVATIQHDPVRLAAEKMVASVRKALQELRHADGNQKRQAEEMGEEVGPIAGAGDCACCGRFCPGGPDRLKSGYCNADYLAWRKEGYPDRVYFEQMRRGGVLRNLTRGLARGSTPV